MEGSRRIETGQSGRRKAPAKALSAQIITLKPSSGHHDRAELIRDVVDGFRRLRGSVLRFILLFSNGEDASVQRANGAKMLSVLAQEAKAARFDRLRELKLTIRHARRLENMRDAVFSETFCDDPVAMREAAAELEHVDAVLVGLCVEHVLERHLSASRPARRTETSAAQRAASPTPEHAETPAR